ncbi:hypothetical protein RGK87_10505 [Agrobacterium fabacearum]|uniref:hypothetical protein n=1 Tax=Agrobacterium tumefaciens TaxID=358 RepID=UPI0028535209|nr:hypothetical protein [Agrobacterium tumefaciens]MDR5009443.1 hypothetical protein [Agrobacterium tumefaciens]
MSNTPRYSGQSPLLRRLVNDVPADGQTCKIATKSEPADCTENLTAKGFEAVGHDARLVAPQHLTTPTQETTSHTSETEAAVTASPLQAPKQWRYLSEGQKLLQAHMAAENSGALAFTINFSDRLQATLKGSGDPTRLISGYIGRELRKALGHSLPHLFTLEVSRTGKLHAHGVVVVGDDLDEERILTIDKALGRAGGKLKAARIVRQTQSYLDHLHDGEGWAKYLSKARSATSRHLGTDKISFISTDLLRLAKG